MGLTDRDGLSFSYDGEGPAVFLNEYSALYKEVVDLARERELGVVTGNVEGVARVSNNLRLRQDKIKEMSKIINTPQFQASLKANPSLQIQLDNVVLETNARNAEIMAASVPADIKEADIIPELTDEGGNTIRMYLSLIHI